MQIQSFKKENELTMKISGRLDTLTAPKLEEAVMENLEGVTSLIMDLADLEYVSSAGLRVLLLANKWMKGKGPFILRNVTEEVKEIFEVTGFADIMNIES